MLARPGKRGVRFTVPVRKREPQSVAEVFDVLDPPRLLIKDQMWLGHVGRRVKPMKSTGAQGNHALFHGISPAFGKEDQSHPKVNEKSMMVFCCRQMILQGCQ